MITEIYPRPQKIEYLSEEETEWQEKYKEVLSRPQAYILKVGEETELLASDEDGLYYGNLTLRQIMAQKEKEKGDTGSFVIADYPSIEWRGVIEGFYGIPWTQEERLQMIKDISQYKMNLYVYAPKDDPYHRARWRELYPQKEQEQLAGLAKTAEEHHVQFCWTIHPGDTMRFDREDADAAVRKLEQLYEMGIRRFGVLFDDITHNQDGKLQAEFLNQVDDLFVKKKGDVEPLLMVGTRYCAAWGPGMEEYFRPLVENLHEDIQIMWTGAATMSNVTRDVFEWPKEQIGSKRNMAVWWNYPVNDYCDGKLLIGPVKNLSRSLDNTSLFLSNPMNQAEASKIAVYSIADYCWNVEQYDCGKSWERSIHRLVPEAEEAFGRFASNICYLKEDGGASGEVLFEESAYLKEKIEKLTGKMKTQEAFEEEAREMLDEFRQMEADYRILKKIKNQNLLREITPFLEAYYDMARIGAVLMECLVNQKQRTVRRLKPDGEIDVPVEIGTQMLLPMLEIVGTFLKKI